MRPCAALLLWATLCLPAAAQQVQPVPYDEVAQTVPGRIDFDFLPERAGPGYNFDHGLAFDGGHIGEHFAGQTLNTIPFDGNLFDGLAVATATAPLTLRMGMPGRTLSVSHHRAFRSNALYPLGPTGQPHPEARGEGAVAFLFDRDICAFALRVHTQYEDDLGTQRDHLGPVELLFLARDGRIIARAPQQLPAGITSLGFRRDGGRADIAGVMVLNLDPGGISLDDIAFGCTPMIG
ncbi:hypothetical protein [Actibacterium sp. D379-3]